MYGLCNPLIQAYLALLNSMVMSFYLDEKVEHGFVNVLKTAQLDQIGQMSSIMK